MDSDKKLKQQKLLKKLISERQRKGVTPYTDDELYQKYSGIRDGATIWLEQCIEYNQLDWITKAQQLFDHACKVLSRLDRQRMISK